MDLQVRKYQLIQAIIKTQNENLVSVIERLFQKDDVDFWDSLSNHEKHRINQGLLELDDKQSIPWDSLIKEIEDSLD